jgi:hypothetical protein
VSGIDRDHIEREVKLEVDGGFEVPSLDGASPLEPRRSTRSTTTPSISGCSTRASPCVGRSGEGTRWTVKFPSAEMASAGGLARREVDIDSDAVEPPSTVSELVAPFLAGASLAPVARLVSVRERWRSSPPTARRWPRSTTTA